MHKTCPHDHGHDCSHHDGADMRTASVSLAIALQEIEEVVVIEDLADKSTTELLQLFNSCQGNRPKLYKVMQTGFGHYNKFPIAEGAFNLLLQKITQQFSNISQQIIKIEEALKSRGETEIAGLLRQVQVLEKENLQQTVQFHLAAKAHSDAILNEKYVGFEEAEYEQTAKARKHEIGVTIENINEVLTMVKEAEAQLLFGK
eukprot:TRINITY_DN12068_c0_g1_i1.p1 TRINITY_DN12068_c0_g1~~TRINITY_DN12068_c0_g1_i1.p1  ORF type:complete len:202 (-),score=53.48 TRINITY_DN12068_c0_g1_i1:107-712(-)